MAAPQRPIPTFSAETILALQAMLGANTTLPDVSKLGQIPYIPSHIPPSDMSLATGGGASPTPATKGGGASSGDSIAQLRAKMEASQAADTTTKPPPRGAVDTTQIGPALGAPPGAYSKEDRKQLELFIKQARERK